jgi:hypothetical protein
MKLPSSSARLTDGDAATCHLVIALRRMLHCERASKTVALSSVVLYQAQLVKRDSTPSTTMSPPKIC